MPITFYIHPSATIDSNVSIGEGSKIWHGAHIMSGARLGDNCKVGQNVFIADQVRIGNNVKIQNNVSVYKGVTCEDDVFLGPSMVFTNVINPRSHINRKNEYRPTLIKKGVSIGANATILCGIQIGKYAMIAAAAVVTKDVKDYALMIGNPALQKGWYCLCGLRLEFNCRSISLCSCGKSFYLKEGVCIRQ